MSRQKLKQHQLQLQVNKQPPTDLLISPQYDRTGRAYLGSKSIVSKKNEEKSVTLYKVMLQETRLCCFERCAFRRHKAQESLQEEAPVSRHCGTADVTADITGNDVYIDKHY